MPDEPIEAKIERWLSTQGYPLEMKLAHTFVHAGFHVIQSMYYRDPRTETQRELDVYAHVQRDIDGGFARLAALVECKSDKSKPWVVFVSDFVQLADRARVVQRSATSLGHYWLEQISLRSDITGLTLFQLPQRPGYGVTAAFSEKLDVPYAALMGSAGAAYAESLEYANPGGRQSPLVVNFPIVVTDAPLFACWLGKDGRPQLENVDRTVIAWRNPVYRMPHCMIHIVHSSAIEDFVRQMRTDFDFLMKYTEEEIEEAMKRMRSQKKAVALSRLAASAAKGIARNL